MKSQLLTIVLLLLVVSATMLSAQTPKVVSLEQTDGRFSVESLKLAPGAYVFEVANNGVDRELGFVLAPKGKPQQEYHIPEAYLDKTIGKGEKAKSKLVVLEKGEYEYFCPLNPTPMYVLTVE